MKKTLLKKTLLAAALLLFFGGNSAWADEVTVTDGQPTTWIFNDLTTNTVYKSVTNMGDYYLRAWVEDGSDNPNRTFTVKSCDETILTFTDGAQVTVTKYLEANGVLITSGGKGTAPAAGSTAGMDDKVGLPSFAFNTTVPGTCYVKIKKEGNPIAETCRHRISFATSSTVSNQSSSSFPDGQIEELSYEAGKAGSFFIYDVSGSGKFDIYAVRFVPKYQQITIGTTGFATIGNIAGAHLVIPDGLTAYKATANTNSVKLTSVTGIRMGEGYVVEGTPGTYNFYATPTDPGSSNKGGDMVRVNADMENFAATDGDYYRYILGNDEETAKFFVPSGSGTLAAGKAYLKTTTNLTAGMNARGISIVFSDDITGINEVQATTVEAGKKDGKYFENGKFVIYKNGMKYNVNGQLIK